MLFVKESERQIPGTLLFGKHWLGNSDKHNEKKVSFFVFISKRIKITEAVRPG